MRRSILQWAALLLGVLSLECSSVEPALPPSMELILGDGQAGIAGESLEMPLVVRVTDHRGRAMANAEVIFRVASGDGVFHYSQDAACTSLYPSESAWTTADGYAGVPFTPLSVGSITVATQLSNHLDQPPLIFTAEASSPGWILSKVSGDDQGAVESYEQLPESFVVKLTTDYSLVPVAGVAVAWEVTSGGGYLLPGICGDLDTIPATVTVRTLYDGTTGPSDNSMFFRPGAYGVNTVSASVLGAQGSPVTFTAEVALQVIWLGNPYIGPGFDPKEVSVPVGASVEWRNADPSAHIVSTSAPPGGTPFDSGTLNANDSFQFVPDAPGTWRYEDTVSGATGVLAVY